VIIFNEFFEESFIEKNMIRKEKELLMTHMIPFEQRFGLTDKKPIHDDFPESARVALVYLIEDLWSKNYIISNENTQSWRITFNELYRVGRTLESDAHWNSTQEELFWLIKKMDWFKIFTFCERVYSRLLTKVDSVSLEEVQEYFSLELNQLLMEENIDYKFEIGQFERKGRLQTQKSINKMGSVLSDSSLIDVRRHYNKALKFFNQTPEADYSNSVADAP